MTFEVEAGKLNYAGVFIYEMSGFNWASGTLNDRLTVVLTVMEQRFPELLEQYEVANGLFPDDRFVQFYLQEKQQSLREQANET